MQMRSFLMTWNPAHWAWNTLEDQLRELETEGSFKEGWSCGNRKDLPVGSRVFLIRLGEEPRGIMGVGVTLTEPEEGPHYDLALADEGKMAIYIGICWHSMYREPRIPFERLTRPPFSDFHWAAQAAGVEIPPEVAEALAVEWGVKARGEEFRLPEETTLDSGYPEGSVRPALVNAYERSPHARAKCIAHYGACCSACGFDFAAVYGEIAAGFIHVHHNVPLSQVAPGYRVDPIRDLRPMCPNCHAVLHMQNPPMGVDELRSVLGTK
jgi:5-methylcytosine-specific restriction protein A